ncbi:MAG: ketopantoate reductase family protein [Balneolaceae bacterium]
MESPEIYIIGSGAIGKALAVFLQQENKPVILVRGSVDHKPVEENVITVLDQDNQKYQQKITTTTFSNLASISGIVLIATKTFANTDIAKKLKDINGSFSIVLLQNGLNIERPFESFDEVYRCVLFSTSQVTSENTVRFKTVTDSPVGLVQGGNANPELIVSEISTPYFGFRSEPNILKYVWDKTIINCAFNSICPLLETDNGIFHRNSEAAQLAKIVIAECVALAEKYDLDLDKNEIEETLMLISKRADGQLISTYEDIRKERRTEIDSLNLEISRLADEIGAPELVSNTKLLGEMIRIKSEINLT